MTKKVGSFVVEEAFYITYRGWVLAASLTAVLELATIYGLRTAFLYALAALQAPLTVVLLKTGLLISDQLTPRQELVAQLLVGTAIVWE
ncbi:hypothetical protein [Hymenobacter crusticola]|uniref:Uncharacterized protein n=1 Tax=Hymenobacter crusticola TaxID=1770526 RepID=A0A243WK44_9BACT|nr:hypothetical protein [Hymenobacter crusticola]OUJ76236.1 hypothetical protein BXP70_02955 [Hymenobacter crusticola]